MAKLVKKYALPDISSTVMLQHSNKLGHDIVLFCTQNGIESINASDVLWQVCQRLGELENIINNIKQCVVEVDNVLHRKLEHNVKWQYLMETLGE